MSLTIHLPWPPPELSPNARVHWRTLHQATHGRKRMDGYKDVAWGLAKAEMQNRAFTFPFRKAVAHVIFVVPDKRRRDLDNCMAMLKPVWDGFVAAGLLVDDDSEHLRHAAPEMRMVKNERYVEVTLSHD